MSLEVGLQALRDPQTRRRQRTHPGGVAGVQVLEPTGRAGGQSGPLQRGERPAASLMLLSTVGYLQGGKEGHTVVTTPGPTAGVPTQPLV